MINLSKNKKTIKAPRENQGISLPSLTPYAVKNSGDRFRLYSESRKNLRLTKDVQLKKIMKGRNGSSNNLLSSKYISDLYEDKKIRRNHSKSISQHSVPESKKNLLESID